MRGKAHVEIEAIYCEELKFVIMGVMVILIIVRTFLA